MSSPCRVMVPAATGSLPTGSAGPILPEEVQQALERARHASLPAVEKVLAQRALPVLAEMLEEARSLLEAMAASASQQDQHNARIHGASLVESEAALRKLLAAPADGNAWWQFGLMAFNNR